MPRGVLKPIPSPPAIGLASAESAYRGGRYAEAEAAARPQLGSADSTTALKARSLMAYAAARRGDLRLGREWFGETVSTGGRSGEVVEDAAYQHAVLTAALGDTAAAEREFIEFMKRHPESPLVHAAVQRIGRLHGGDLPKPAEDRKSTRLNSSH